MLRVAACQTLSGRAARVWATHEGYLVVFINQSIKSNLFVTQNYTNPIKDGKIEQCVNRTQRQLRATLTGAQTDIYGKS